jgi:hypothetical protein
MRTVTTALGDVAKALVVLAMCLFLLGASPPDSAPGGTVIQQAATLDALVTALCGDHGHPPLACHAPNTCCRPDHMLLPPRQAAIGPAYGRANVVVYAPHVSVARQAAAAAIFRARAPPLA